ncbi:MAG: GTP diphosphokinase [Gammaproteobacteria bacterium]
MVTRTEKSRAQDAGKALDLPFWVNAISERFDESDKQRIFSAVQLADKLHAGQIRESGEPYLTHCLAVAEIVQQLNLDTDSVLAAILHDSLEDTNISLEELTDKFGEVVSRRVDGVTKMGKIDEIRQSDPDQQENTSSVHTENLRKLLLAMAEDVRVVLIKLADRLHNMRTLKYLSEEKQQRIARETLDIYAPLANQLGIWQIKWELEDLSLRYLNPDEYRRIAALLDGKRIDREKHIEEVKVQLSSLCEEENIQAEITGRPKHIYSIWRKMQRKQIGFNQVFDIQAVRVLVNKTSECYAVLGMVHGLWQHIPKEFDDYIAHPKSNNYRSLHTAVIGPGSRPLEVQIRTHEMHEHAELGVAAHWRYKEGRQQKSDAAFEHKINWLRQLLEWKEEETTADAFVDRFRSEAKEERIYVMTPKGRVIDLPADSTGLDFAYHVHTDIGHRCRGVKINGHMVSLKHKLDTGDQVEVLTAKYPSPSRDWINPDLGYLATSRARAKVRHWFRSMDRDINIDAGRASLEAELKRLGIRNVSLEPILQKLNYKNIDTMMAAIGHGDLHVSSVINALTDLTQDKNIEAFNLPVRRQRRKDLPVQDEVTIEGVGNLLTQFAKCCHPVPQDLIVGYITQGRGVTIHRTDCANILHLKEMDQSRLIEVDWGRSQDQLFPVEVEAMAYDRQGLLRDISAELTNQKINVIGVTTHTDKKDMLARMHLKLEVANIEQLSKVLKRISQLRNVVEVRRKV